MRILVTGAAGMLGQDLIPALQAAGHEAIACGRAQLDVTDWPQVREVIAHWRPDAIIQAAAVTDVDGAERNPLDAFKVNVQGTRHVALACQEFNVPLVYISSDYVFDGKGQTPYLEWAPTQPPGVYGQSKLGGEQAVRELLTRFYIVRTSWLYGAGGKNFVETMRRLGRTQARVRVVADQLGQPTWTVPLSRAIVALIATGCYGTHHLSGQGVTSWHGFAARIMALDGHATCVDAISSTELDRPAPRPAWSVMANVNALLSGVAPLPPWEESLAEYLASTPACVG
jgi:dTDP-4-dehydrorhamnose reductase